MCHNQICILKPEMDVQIEDCINKAFCKAGLVCSRGSCVSVPHTECATTSDCQGIGGPDQAKVQCVEGVCALPPSSTLLMPFYFSD